jgi:hypothetical protein
LKRPIHILAGINVLVHLLALALSAFWLRPGTSLYGAERWTYLAEHSLEWSLGWGAWMLCALALVAFFAVLANAVPDGGLLVALMVCLAGAEVDLLCDLMQMTLPKLARADPLPQPLLLTLEHIAGAGGLVVANGAYTVATLLATLRLRRRPEILPFTILAGWGVFLFGSFLVLAGMTDWTLLAVSAAGPTVLLFCAWVVLVAHSLERPGRPP